MELIRNHLSHGHGDNLYVEDCWSSQVLDFFEKNGLTLQEQTGYENFSSYYPMKSDKAKPDIRPWSQLNSRVMYLPLYNLMMEEPDKLREFNLKVQQRMLNLEKNQTEADVVKTGALHNSGCGTNK